MHTPRVGLYFNNIGSICTDSLRHGNGLSALLLLTRAAKTRSMESGLYTERLPADATTRALLRLERTMNLLCH